jgi:hypothetical protein
MFSLIDRDNNFFIILLGVKLFHLDEETVTDILIDNLVVFGTDIVDDKVLTGVVQDLFVVEGNQGGGELIVW